MKILQALELPIAAILMGCLWVAPGCAGKQDCAEAVSTAEMQICANQLYQEADAELNQVYRQLNAQLSAQRKTQLKASQQAWLAFRDKNAVFAAGVAEGGSMASLVEITELTALTKSRTEQLRAYLKQ
jgi:uncharacterized protein YecT (DUF1311 family)